MKRSIEAIIETWASQDSSRPLLLRGARRVGKTYAAEVVGRRVASKAFVKLDFLLQNDRMEVVPVEVKSARNIRARTLASFMEKACAPYAYILSENDFSRGEDGAGRELRRLPLYAAFCIDSGYLRDEA